MAIPPDINSVQHGLPDLSNLPIEVASRVRNSWRAGSILSRYVFEVLELRATQQDCGDSRALHSQHLVALLGPTPADAMHLRAEATKLQFGSFPRREYAHAELESSYKVRPGVDTNHSTCNRLAAEAELLFFRMAIELDAGLRDTLDKFPLLDCLRRVRNCTAHHKPLDVDRRDRVFHLAFTNGAGTDVIEFQTEEAWFLDVTEDDLNKSFPPKKPVDPDVARWFLKQCERWPLHYLLVAATEELRKFYAPPT
jgi:hypothetical protein